MPMSLCPGAKRVVKRGREGSDEFFDVPEDAGKKLRSSRNAVGLSPDPKKSNKDRGEGVLGGSRGGVTRSGEKTAGEAGGRMKGPRPASQESSSAGASRLSSSGRQRSAFDAPNSPPRKTRSLLALSTSSRSNDRPAHVFGALRVRPPMRAASTLPLSSGENGNDDDDDGDEEDEEEEEEEEEEEVSMPSTRSKSSSSYPISVPRQATASKSQTKRLVVASARARDAGDVQTTSGAAVGKQEGEREEEKARPGESRGSGVPSLTKDVANVKNKNSSSNNKNNNSSNKKSKSGGVDENAEDVKRNQGQTNARGGRDAVGRSGNGDGRSKAFGGYDEPLDDFVMRSMAELRAEKTKLVEVMMRKAHTHRDMHTYIHTHTRTHTHTHTHTHTYGNPCASMWPAKLTRDSTPNFQSELQKHHEGVKRLVRRRDAATEAFFNKFSLPKRPGKCVEYVQSPLPTATDEHRFAGSDDDEDGHEQEKLKEQEANGSRGRKEPEKRGNQHLSIKWGKKQPLCMLAR
jgi:hypothetical protein